MKIKQETKTQLKKYLVEKQKEEDKKIKIYSAQKLSDEEWESVYKLFPTLKGKKVTNIIDEKMIAGIIIRKGSKMIDLSLNSLLQDIKRVGYEVA